MVDFNLNSRYTKINGFHPPKARCSASESNTQSHVTNQLDFTYLVSHSPHHSLLSTSPPRPLRVPRLTPPANFPPSTNVWALNTSHLILWTGFPTHIYNLPILQVRHWWSKNLSHLSNIPCGSASKESTYNVEDQDSITWLGRPPREGKGYPLQYSGLENSTDCTVHGVTKSQTRLSNSHFHFHPISHNYKPRCGSLQHPHSSALEYFISLQHSREPTGKWGECTEPPLPTGRKQTGEGQTRRQKHKAWEGAANGMPAYYFHGRTKKAEDGSQVTSLGAKEQDQLQPLSDILHSSNL